MHGIPKYEFFKGKELDTLDVVLQGGSYGVETPFMKKLISTCRKSGHAVVSFNFLYHERGDDHSSGPELIEELATLDEVLKISKASKFGHVRFVAKSLGGIVASYFLKNLSVDEQKKYSIVVLGYVLGSIELNNFLGAITIIQGEKDKFGGIDKVKEDLKNAKSRNIKYFEVAGADHSFRDPETKEPKYEAEAIKKLLNIE